MTEPRVVEGVGFTATVSKYATAIRVPTNVERALIVGRNGTRPIEAVSVWCGDMTNPDILIELTGIGMSGNAIRGGLWIDSDTMDRLCKAWQEARNAQAKV